MIVSSVSSIPCSSGSSVTSNGKYLLFLLIDDLRLNNAARVSFSSFRWSLLLVFLIKCLMLPKYPFGFVSFALCNWLISWCNESNSFSVD